MNTLSLRYALEVNRTRSITKAAQNLYMGQPNLSRAIRDLEKDLGIVIFERTTKGVTPTEKGRLFLERAASILAQLDDLESLYRSDNAESIYLNVALPRVTYASHAFTRFLNTLHPAHEMSIHFKEEAPMNAVQDVVRGDMDFAVIRYQEPYFGFFLNLMEEWNLDYEPLFSFQQLALVSRSHPLAGRVQICAQDLMPYIEVVHGDYQVPALTLAEFPTSLPPTASHNQKIYVYDRGSQFEVLRQVSGSYMWVSPIPQETLDEYQMLTLPCQDFDTTSCDAIIYPRNKKLSDWSKRCIEFMKDYVKSLR